MVKFNTYLIPDPYICISFIKKYITPYDTWQINSQFNCFICDLSLIVNKKMFTIYVSFVISMMFGIYTILVVVVGKDEINFSTDAFSSSLFEK